MRRKKEKNEACVVIGADKIITWLIFSLPFIVYFKCIWRVWGWVRWGRRRLIWRRMARWRGASVTCWLPLRQSIIPDSSFSFFPLFPFLFVPSYPLPFPVFVTARSLPCLFSSAFLLCASSLEDKEASKEAKRERQTWRRETRKGSGRRGRKVKGERMMVMMRRRPQPFLFLSFSSVTIVSFPHQPTPVAMTTSCCVDAVSFSTARWRARADRLPSLWLVCL